MPNLADPAFDWTLLYVADPLASAALYEKILGRPPVDKAPTFTFFALASGVKIGFWLKEEMEPAATAPGGSELAFTEGDPEAVDRRLAEWRDLGLAILQEPTSMDFGYTFTAADPDGHRLRVFAPKGR